jgi:DNA-directed RNA polymerase subunit RPC12/RpoP
METISWTTELTCAFCGEDLSGFMDPTQQDRPFPCPGCGARIVFTASVTGTHQAVEGMQVVQVGAGTIASPDGTRPVLLVTAWDPDEEMSVTRVEAVTGLSPVTIREYCRKGLFPGATRIGREWHIPRRAVFSFVQAHGHRRGRPYVRPGTTVEWGKRRWRVTRRYRAGDRWLLDLEPLEEGEPPRKGVPAREVKRAQDRVTGETGR